MRYLSMLFVASIMFAVVLGCKWDFGMGMDPNWNANKNSNSSNRSNTDRNGNDDYNDYKSAPSPDSNSAQDMTPTTMDIDEMVSGSGDKDMVGRMVTVTGGVLEHIDSTTLRIRGAYGGAAFYCYGDFADYMSMASRVDSLSQSGHAPKATVKGIYKVASVGNGGELSPCVLSDIQK